MVQWSVWGPTDSNKAGSFHCLLALFLRKKAPQKKVKKRLFFEAMWVRDERCKEVIEGAWDPLRADVNI